MKGNRSNRKYSRGIQTTYLIPSGGERTIISIQRGRTELLENLPSKSIALDGFVQGPAIDTEHERYSFDHHDKCIRLVTQATCQQVLTALQLGLDPSKFTVYVNDIDADTVLSVWLLLHPEEINNPNVKLWTGLVGAIDAHGPSFGTTFSPDEKRLSDIFFLNVMKPERDLKKLKKYNEANLSELIVECLIRTNDFADGLLESAESNPIPQYSIIRKGTRDWMLFESNENIFEAVYKDGYTKAVVYQKLPNGTFKYTIAKKSDFVSSFPVGPASLEGSILFNLNKNEIGWGGSSTIGGSPRNADGTASKLNPEEVFNIVEETLKGEEK